MRHLSKIDIVAVIALTVLSVAFSSCGHKKQAVEMTEAKYDSLFDVVWYTRDTIILLTIDSLETAGELTENRQIFSVVWRTIEVGRYHSEITITTRSIRPWIRKKRAGIFIYGWRPDFHSCE